MYFATASCKISKTNQIRLRAGNVSKEKFHPPLCKISCIAFAPNPRFYTVRNMLVNGRISTTIFWLWLP